MTIRVPEFRSPRDVLEHAAGQFRSRQALVSPAAAAPTVWTYADLAEGAQFIAGALLRRGIRPAHRVASLLAPGPEWVAAMFAVLRAGAAFVPFPADMPQDRAASLCRSLGVSALLVRGRTAETEQGPSLCPVDELLAQGQPAAPVPVEPGDTAMLAFTSGSTAQPRAVELSHRNLASNLNGILRVRAAGEGSTFLSMLPPHHMFEFTVGLLGPLACGARIVYPGTLLPNRLLDTARDWQVSHALAVPALLAALFDELRDDLAAERGEQPIPETASPAAAARHIGTQLDSSARASLRSRVRARVGDSLRALVVGGAALNPAWGAIGAFLGIEVDVGYGMTEASPVISMGIAGSYPEGSVGRPLSGVEVRISPQGEILVRGPNVMKGYFGDPQASREALEGGWLHTGDLGCLDEAGFLRVSGRIKEVMVSASGDTVSPGEIEPWYSDPLFAEHCVLPVPDRDGNDVPTLVVVPRGPAADEDEIRRAAYRLRAAAPARLRVGGIICVAGPLPRTATGKLLRRVLAESLL